MTEPLCCNVNPLYVCKGCGYRVCHDHWYDNYTTSIYDEFHVPTIELSDTEGGDYDTGICLRCQGTVWNRYGKT